QPIAVKRIYIDKGPKEKRPLGIPAIKDRIVQMALKMTIEPIFEIEFLPTSHGFRPRRGSKGALAEVDKLLKEGYSHVVDVDFKSYFDTISHKHLMDEVEARIADGRILKLIRKFLEQEIMEGVKKWTPSEGTPQGGLCKALHKPPYA
ncbi:MAG: RNA-directed DNA polymerase, partial [Gammaproteobacteria bacterium]